MFGSLANNTASATLTLADSLMNDSEKRLIASKDWPFLWRQYTLTTAASTQAYTLPAYTNHPQSVYVTVGSYRYTPKEVSTRSEWDMLNEVTITSDIPTHYFIYDGQVLLFPRPTSASNTITVNARRRARDLTRADYTTGTITSTVTSGTTTTVTGSGTTWSAAMVGRWIQITGTDAANTGDGMWYEIATVPSSTTLTLTRAYAGTAISAGTATYTIGEVSLIPEPHDQIPVFEALSIYFGSVNPKPAEALFYKQKTDEAYTTMFKDYTSKSNVVLDDGGDNEDINPNLLVSY